MTVSNRNSRGPVTWGVIPAAGIGIRFGGGLPKQYLRLGERTLLECAIDALIDSGPMAGVLVAVATDDQRWRELGAFARGECEAAPGGSNRAASVLNALAALAGRAADDDWVLVHDAARPCLDASQIARMRGRLDGHAVGGILAVPVADTIKRVDADGAIVETVARDGLWRAQTPQMFRYRLLAEALQVAADAGVVITDESMALELAGHRPAVVEGSERNIKVTRAEDLELARLYLREALS